MTERSNICSICQREFCADICFNSWTIKHGNNAAPINAGKCCDVCNGTHVLPARVRLMKREQEQK
jgi:hypothetical protein